MKFTLWRKFVVVLTVTLGCLYGVIGLPSSVEEAKNNLSERIRLGLDLKGGVHLILQVQVQDAIRSECDRTIARLQSELTTRGIDVGTITRNDPRTVEEADSIMISIEGVQRDQVSDFRNAVEEMFPEWIPAAQTSSSWEMTMRPSALASIKRETVTQTIATIENRINGLGLTEPTIQQHGRADAEYEILVQLPGLTDPGRVMGILQMTAQLEITAVLGGPYATPEAAVAANNGVLPPNAVIRPYVDRNVRAAGPEYYVLNRLPVVTGSDLRDARASRDSETQTWETGFTLSREAGNRFGDYTGANINNLLAIVLDRRIKSVATIQSRITDQGRITGLGGGPEEARDLALVLRAGALPAGVEFLEERTVGASLGADSIRQGVQSSLLGLALIIVCMLVYYRKAGINAVLALILNLLILLAVLSYVGFTLTLPGIAGVILTIGMAVDANVLIFERIREELRAGKTVAASISAGFSKAFLTIIDTNVTTIIAAGFLFLFGRGPVRGFAVTLGIGLIANLFTSVFVSRMIFDFSLSGKKQVKELSI